jgi:hypothetical protein
MTGKHRAALRVTFAASLLTSCSTFDDPVLDEAANDPPSWSDESGILQVVNRLPLEVLRDRAGLSPEAAVSVLGHRSGADGVEGSADDDPIDSVDELLAVPLIGADEIARLLDFARAEGYVLEPVVELKYVSNLLGPSRCTDEPTYFAFYFDRDATLELNGYHSGGGGSAEFRLTAWTADSTISSPWVEYPRLFIPIPPGQSQKVTIAVEHRGSGNSCWRGNVVLKKQPAPEMLGACGSEPRNLFLRWIEERRPWHRNFDMQYVREELANDRVRIQYCRAVSCVGWDYRLIGSVDGPRGPILQVEERDNYNGRLLLNAMLFVDREERRFHEVRGQLYFTLPDGNFLVSEAMGSDGTRTSAWIGVGETLRSVTPDGGINWTRRIGPGKPPLPVVVTANGNLVVSYLRLDDPTVARSEAAGIVTLDPATGQDVVDNLVDRSFLCQTNSSSPSCVASKARALGEFASWWAEESAFYGTWVRANPPNTICDDNDTCTTAGLRGWYVEEDGTDVLEVSLDSSGPNVYPLYTNRILFFEEAGVDEVDGQIYRRLGPDRLLTSLAMGSSLSPAGVEPWYYTDEELHVLTRQGSNGAIVGGKPFLAPVGGLGTSTGAMLPDNTIYWTATSIREDRPLVRKVIDLDTFSASTAVPRQLEGLCRPRGNR